jgi:hypothetical protein
LRFSALFALQKKEYQVEGLWTLGVTQSISEFYHLYLVLILDLPFEAYCDLYFETYL